MPIMLLSSRVLTTRNDVPAASARVEVARSAVVMLDAPKRVALCRAGRQAYEFLFWDADAVRLDEAAARFTAPSTETSFCVTAWYRPVAGVLAGLADESGLSAITGVGAVMITARSVAAEFGRFVGWLPLSGVTAGSV